MGLVNRQAKQELSSYAPYENLLRIIQEVRKWWWLIAAFALMGGVGGYGAFIFKKTFESKLTFESVSKQFRHSTDGIIVLNNAQRMVLDHRSNKVFSDTFWASLTPKSTQDGGLIDEMRSQIALDHWLKFFDPETSDLAIARERFSQQLPQSLSSQQGSFPLKIDFKDEFWTFQVRADQARVHFATTLALVKAMNASINVYNLERYRERELTAQNEEETARTNFKKAEEKYKEMLSLNAELRSKVFHNLFLMSFNISKKSHANFDEKIKGFLHLPLSITPAERVQDHSLGDPLYTLGKVIFMGVSKEIASLELSDEVKGEYLNQLSKILVDLEAANNNYNNWISQYNLILATYKEALQKANKIAFDTESFALPGVRHISDNEIAFAYSQDRLAVIPSRLVLVFSGLALGLFVGVLCILAISFQKSIGALIKREGYGVSK